MRAPSTMRRWFMSLAVLALVGACEERSWKMDGDILVVDNNAILYRGPVWRCKDAANREYLCENIPQGRTDPWLIQRGYFVRRPSQGFRALSERAFERTGQPIALAVSRDAPLDRTESLILAFADYAVLYRDRELVWFIPEEYLQAMRPDWEGDTPYPLNETDLEASIQRIIARRCGDDVRVDVVEAPDGSYAGTAGRLALESNNGVYWSAEGKCSAVEPYRDGRRLVP